MTVTIAKFILGTKLLNAKREKVKERMTVVKIIAFPEWFKI